MPATSLNLPKWIVDELNRHVAVFEEYDNRSHLIRIVLAQWLNDNRDDLNSVEEELEDDEHVEYDEED